MVANLVWNLLGMNMRDEFSFNSFQKLRGLGAGGEQWPALADMAKLALQNVGLLKPATAAQSQKVGKAELAQQPRMPTTNRPSILRPTVFGVFQIHSYFLLEEQTRSVRKQNFTQNCL